MQPRNPWLCFLVAGGIIAVAVVAAGGIIAANVAGRVPDPTLSHLASTSLGALASFLVMVPRGSVAAEQQQQQPAPPARAVSAG